MDILSYLTSLIKTRKEVGIPGLGTIYKKKSPGRYDAETHSFLPPSYVLEFTEEIRESDALINYISKQRNISADASSYYVEKFAEDIHKELQENHEASLHPLGTLSDASGQLEFKADTAQNFGFDFYGMPALKDEVVTERTAATAEENPATVTEVPEIEEPDTKAPYTDEALLAETPVETTSEAHVTAVDETNEAPASTEEEPLQLETEDDTAPETAETPEPVTSEEAESTADLPEAEKPEAVVETDSADVTETEQQQEVTDAASGFVVTNSVSEEPITETEEQADETPETTEPAMQLTEVVQENRVEEENPGDEFAVPQETVTPAEEPSQEVENVPPPQVIVPNPPPAEKEEEPFTINERYARNQFITPEPPEPVHPENTFYNSNDDEQEKKSVPLYLKILITLLLIFIGVAAVYFIRPDLFKGLLKHEEAPVPITKSLERVNTQPTDSLSIADSLNKSSQPTAAAATKKDSAKAVKTPAVTPEKTAVPAPVVTKADAPKTEPAKPAAAIAGITYELIGSGVSSQKEADHFIAQMKKVGINAKAIAPERGKKKIKMSIGTFKDYNSAHAERPKLEKKLGIKGLYIYTNKPE